MKIVSIGQMKAIEKSANKTGITYETMMAHAGNGVAEWVLAHLEPKMGVIGLVGSGNNGGDTLIALTRIAVKGYRTQAFLVRARDEDPLVTEYINAGGVVIDLTIECTLQYLEAAIGPGSILLDGMLGTGFHLPMKGSLLSLMTQIHDAIQQQPEIMVIAVDCPSGVDCDSGEATEQCLKADYTLTMAAAKQGLLIEPASSLTGEITLVDIGIGDISQYIADDCPILMDEALAFNLLPKRPDTGHKGTFGTCLVVAGTRQYTGAAYLAGKAAYLAGCGLVNVATVPAVRESLAGRLIEAVWTIILENEGGYAPSGVKGLRKALESSDALALGPGWGLKETNLAFLEALLPMIPTDLPVVFDADGLKLLGRIEKWWEKVPAQTILTPHPGEMSEITGRPIAEIQANRWNNAKKYAQDWGVTLVLKGAHTVIALPDGQIFISPVSDSALGTAGSGDVLTGILGGLLAQGAQPKEAALLGVWLHAFAGIQAHQQLGGAESVTALDILEAIPSAFLKIKRPV
ncbi:NAD(P)H-hydrate dehydratase [Chloroflexota bacterium]|nr:NAD(P)H-hydrate dehydratase [Chloroflexota bacterium]